MKQLLSPFILFSFIVFGTALRAQIQVTPSTNANQLAQVLAGTGVAISNATLNCPSTAGDAAGTFVGTASNIGITQESY